MDREKIEQKVKEILADRLDIDVKKIKSDSDLVDDLGMDSFIALELMFELKERLGVSISREEFTKIRTVRDVVSFVEKVGR